MECCDAAAAEGTTCRPCQSEHAACAWQEPASIMGAHAHHAGSWMIGYRWMEDTADTPEKDGNAYTAMQAMQDGYSGLATDMTMRMHMLELMYAPTDRITVMGMLQYMEMDMTMTMTHAMPGMPAHTHSHSIEGLQDLPVTALVRLYADAHSSVILGAGLSLPVGSVGERNANGQYVHYEMQPGSGTWDALPSLTYEFRAGAWVLGAQAAAVVRLENENESGYRRGHAAHLNTWATWTSPWEPLALTTRLGYRTEGRVQGSYEPAINIASPGDDPANTGGDQLELGLGASLALELGQVPVSLGFEWVDVIDSDLHGVQLNDRQGWRLAGGFSF